MPLNGYTDKQIVHPYRGIPLSYKKEWTMNTHHNMDESQNKYTEWKKPEEK